MIQMLAFFGRTCSELILVILEIDLAPACSSTIALELCVQLRSNSAKRLVFIKGRSLREAGLAKMLNTFAITPMTMCSLEHAMLPFSPYERKGPPNTKPGSPPLEREQKSVLPAGRTDYTCNTAGCLVVE